MLNAMNDMKRTLLALSASAALSAIAAPESLTVEYRVNPCGIDAKAPRLAWKNAPSPERNFRQGAYRVFVASSAERLAADEGDMWDSGRVESSDSIGVAYAGKPLATSQRVFWKVRTWDASGRDTGWSAPAEWTCGVMKQDDWKAKWIGSAPETRPDEDMGAAQWIAAAKDKDGVVTLRRKFDFDGAGEGEFVELVHAALPLHEIKINGNLASDTCGIVRRWNFLRFRDVTHYLKKGENEIEVRILPYEANPAAKGEAFIAKLVFPGGRTLVTDGSWSADGGVKTLGTVREPAFGLLLDMRTETASPAFEKKFQVSKKVASAVLHVTGVGFYEAYLDGLKIGSKVLDPSFTDYNKRVLYSTYRLDGDLPEGEHALKLLVGHG